MTEPWFFADEVVERMDVAPVSIRPLIEVRSLPVHKMGRLWKFKPSEIGEGIRAGGTEGGGKPASKKPPKATRGRS